VHSTCGYSHQQHQTNFNDTKLQPRLTGNLGCLVNNVYLDWAVLQLQMRYEVQISSSVSAPTHQCASMRHGHQKQSERQGNKWEWPGLSNTMSWENCPYDSVQRSPYTACLEQDMNSDSMLQVYIQESLISFKKNP